MSEEVVAPKRRRRSRAAAQAAPLPITATVYMKGRARPLVVACFQATQVPDGWLFACPSAVPGMVKTVQVAQSEISYIEMDRWPDAPVFREAAAQAPQAPQEAPRMVPRPSGPKVYVNPFRANEAAGADLPAQGRPAHLSSFSAEPFGVPDGAAAAAG